MATSTPAKEAPGAPQDEPERVLDRWRARDVALVVAVCAALITCAAGSLGVFLILDSWAEACSWGLGGVL